MAFFLALLPILLILFLMVSRRWGASRAGAAGYLAALAIAILYFGAGPDLLAYAHLKALLLAFDVLFIVWMAYLHFRVADEAGAIDSLAQALKNLTPDRGMLALILGFAFASFLQGIGGFGVPVAIIAPMLVGVGFTPILAVIIPSVGHAWSVTFGSLGSSFQALMGATGLPAGELALPAAVLLGAAGIGTGIAVVQIALGWRGPLRTWAVALLLGIGMAAVQLWLAVSGLWNFAAAGAGVVGLALSVGMARIGFRQQNQAAPLSPKEILLALGAYLILIAVLLALQLETPLRALLHPFALVIDFPETETGLGFITPAGTGRVIHWFTHGGAVLLYASLLAYLVYRLAGRFSQGATRRILTGTVRGVLASSLSITAMVAMAVVMSHAGMTDVLARGLAESVGRGFPLIAPWIGALGAFMTGSNTNSNVVLAALQMRTGQLLGLTIPWVLAAQTAGGAIGSVIAPTKIVVGAATAGVEGQEGRVIARLAAYTAVLIVVVMLVALIFI